MPYYALLTTTATTIGCLSLILVSLSQLFSIVDYQLLPMSSIHKPIAKLISVASRCDTINLSNTTTTTTMIRRSKNEDFHNNNDDDASKTESLKYKRKVGMLLTYYFSLSLRLVMMVNVYEYIDLIISTCETFLLPSYSYSSSMHIVLPSTVHIILPSSSS